MPASNEHRSTRAAAWLGAFLFVSLAIGAVGGWPGLRSRVGSENAHAAVVPQRSGFDLAERNAAGSTAEQGPPRNAAMAVDELPANEALAPRSDVVARVDDPALTARVESIIAEAVAVATQASNGRANGNNVAVALRVIDLFDHSVILERQPRLALAPASNMKLVTSLAALIALGSEWSFATRVDRVGEIHAGRLAGDLVVRAGGDPLFAQDDPEYAQRRLAELAQRVARSGITSVTGDLVLDLGAFAEAGPAPGWPHPDGYWTSSYALAPGLNVNAGLISYAIEPTRPDQPAIARFVPAPTGLDERLDVATVAKRVNNVRVGAYESTGRVALLGEIGAGLPTFTGSFRHMDPVRYFGAVFSAELRRAGVDVRGGVRRERNVAAGVALAAIQTPWIQYLPAINTHSNNGVADAVLIALGHARFGRGDREHGAERVREILESLGTSTDGFVQVGGSGLSRDNRVTAEILSDLLARAARVDDALRQRFVGSLAVAGGTGTLDRRMVGTSAEGRVHAKTGFIRGASALSGYVATLEGRQLAFSILVSYPRLDGLNTAAWKPMHDAIAVALAEWKRP